MQPEAGPGGADAGRAAAGHRVRHGARAAARRPHLPRHGHLRAGRAAVPAAHRRATRSSPRTGMELERLHLEAPPPRAERHRARVARGGRGGAALPGEGRPSGAIPSTGRFLAALREAVADAGPGWPPGRTCGRRWPLHAEVVAGRDAARTTSSVHAALAEVLDCPRAGTARAGLRAGAAGGHRAAGHPPAGEAPPAARRSRPSDLHEAPARAAPGRRDRWPPRSKRTSTCACTSGRWRCAARRRSSRCSAAP